MDRRILDIVQELLAAEQSSVVLRLVESTVFVSALSTTEESAIGRIAAETAEHCAWLVELTIQGGRSPGPRVGDLRSADLHFQEIAHALPRVMKDIESLVGICERAAPQVAADPTVAAVVSRMTERHRKHLDRLRELHAHPLDAVDPLAVNSPPTPSEESTG